MKEETINALDEFIRRVQDLATCIEQDNLTEDGSPRQRAAAVALGEASQTLRDQLQEECV